MAETTPGDRVEAFLDKLEAKYPDAPFAALIGEEGGAQFPLTSADLRAILRTNRSLAHQIVGFGDRIIEASAEIQRATLRAAAAELRQTKLIARGYPEWLENRADQIGRPALDTQEN